MGFAVHVPHYLARAEYPQAARVLVDHVGIATGLYLPTDTLTSAAERAEHEIGEQVAASEEVAQVVAALEQQYDAVISARRAAGHVRSSCPAPTSWPPRSSGSSPGTTTRTGATTPARTRPR